MRLAPHSEVLIRFEMHSTDSLQSYKSRSLLGFYDCGSAPPPEGKKHYVHTQYSVLGRRRELINQEGTKPLYGIQAARCRDILP